MYCHNCGKQIRDDVRFCEFCGAEQPVRQEPYDTYVREENNRFYDEDAYAEHLDDNRSIVTYILLSFITCGIYSFYYRYKLAHDVNIACEGDGDSTVGLLEFILFSIITCGFYSYYWDYKIADRLYRNGSRYGQYFSETGSTILLWDILGALVCGLGQFVAMYLIMRNANAICAVYNADHNV